MRIAYVHGLHQEGSTNLEVEYVWIKDSQVTHLPHFDAQVFFPNLLKYIVSGSQLKFIKREDFSGMPKLQTLNLDSNIIEAIPEDALYDLPNLVDFFIDDNKLKALPTYLLNHALMFQRFKASNNSIEVLEADFLKNNHILKILSMDNNKLKQIRVDFKPYKNLKKLDLLNNVCVNTSFNDWRKKNTVPSVQSEIDSRCR